MKQVKFESANEGEMDYTKMVIDDMYTVLVEEKNPWPKNYTKLKKVEFLDKLLSYLSEQQEFEKCSVLKKMKQDIINESVIISKKNKK